MNTFLATDKGRFSFLTSMTFERKSSIAEMQCCGFAARWSYVTNKREFSRATLSER